MPHHQKYVPTHRAPGKHKAARGPRRALRTGVALTGLAAAVTGVSVTGGMFSSDPGLTPAAADVAPTSASAPAVSGETADAATSTALQQRAQRQVASRSSRRDATRRPPP